MIYDKIMPFIKARPKFHYKNQSYLTMTKALKFVHCKTLPNNFYFVSAKYVNCVCKILCELSIIIVYVKFCELSMLIV